MLDIYHEDTSGNCAKTNSIPVSEFLDWAHASTSGISLLNNRASLILEEER
jgi:hypothetical protein